MASEPKKRLTEHSWGYARQRDGGSLEYRVEHPRWRVWPASRVDLEGDLASFYGPELAAVLATRPTSAFVADGSPVQVRRGARLGTRIDSAQGRMAP